MSRSHRFVLSFSALLLVAGCRMSVEKRQEPRATPEVVQAKSQEKREPSRIESKEGLHQDRISRLQNLLKDHFPEKAFPGMTAGELSSKGKGDPEKLAKDLEGVLGSGKIKDPDARKDLERYIEELKNESHQAVEMVVRAFSNRFLLVWDEPQSKVKHFEIESSSDGVAFASLAKVGANQRHFSAIGLAPGTTLFYRMRFFDGEKFSAYSNVAFASTHDTSTAAGEHHTLVLKMDDTVLAWGLNDFGQVGDGQASGERCLVPTQVRFQNGSPLQNIIAIAAGGKVSLALGGDGSVWSWGNNTVGQLGKGTVGGHESHPVQVMQSAENPLQNIVAIAVGTDHMSASAPGKTHALALTKEGKVFSWGYNPYGQLGNGTNNDSAFPVEVIFGTQPGNGNNPAPTPMTGIPGIYPQGTIVSIAAGESHSLALTQLGDVYAWGFNNYGQLGNNGLSAQQTAIPEKVSLAPGISIVSIAAGNYHSLALGLDETAWAWGRNLKGELGTGASGPALTAELPVRVMRDNLVPLESIHSLAAGRHHSLACLSNGDVMAWGSNLYGQLGDNKVSGFMQSVLPVKALIPAGTMIHTLAAGESHSVACAADGSFYTWGCDGDGDLGDNQVNGLMHSVPKKVVVE